jgi:uncharacterized protein (TIGR02001 family)
MRNPHRISAARAFAGPRLCMAAAGTRLIAHKPLLHNDYSPWHAPCIVACVTLHVRRTAMRTPIIASVAVALAGALVVPVVAIAEEAALAAAPAPFTGNVTLASEYIYRGIGQTNRKPAVQGGFDYAHKSGFYLGTWGSNISWLSDTGLASSSLEWDWYGGYKGSVGDFGYDVGGLYYWYPGTYTAAYKAGSSNPDTFELYVAGTWKFLTLKYSHSLTDTFGFKDSKGAGYLDLTGTYELPGGFSLVAHVGNQVIPGSTPNGRARKDCSYVDWKLGVTKEIVGGVTLGLSYIDTDAKGDKGECYRNAYNKDLGRGTVVLTVGKTF